MFLDFKLFSLINGWAGRSAALDWLIIFCGEYLPYLVLVAFLALIIFVDEPRRTKVKLLLTAVLSMLVSRFVLVELIHFFYQRPRPFLSHEVTQLLTPNDWSFPSGHATVFFALTIACYFYNKRWGIIFFFLATLISLARVAAGVHYPLDILAGFFTGLLAVNMLKLVYSSRL